MDNFDSTLPTYSPVAAAEPILSLLVSITFLVATTLKYLFINSLKVAREK